MLIQLLVIEEDQKLSSKLSEALKNDFAVTCVSASSKALLLLEQKNFGMVLLNTELKDSDAYSLCEQIKIKTVGVSTPILFLTGPPALKSLQKAFEAGADDYISFPYKHDELLIRLKIRSRSKRNSFGAIHLSWELQKAFLEIKGEKVDPGLTPLEFRLLASIARAPTKLVTREYLHRTVWGKGVYVASKSIDKNICTLRKKLGPFGSYVQTVPGRGFFFKYAEKSDR